MTREILLYVQRAQATYSTPTLYSAGTVALLPPCAGGSAVAEAAGSICSENCSGSVGEPSAVVASTMRGASSGGSGISWVGGTYASEVSGALTVSYTHLRAHET